MDCIWYGHNDVLENRANSLVGMLGSADPTVRMSVLGDLGVLVRNP